MNISFSTEEKTNGEGKGGKSLERGFFWGEENGGGKYLGKENI